MIHIGHIVPVEYLKYVQGRPFHLILAHMVKQNKTYRDFYKEEAKRGATIVLDNSNYECGDNWTTPEELIDIYNSLESKNIYLMCPEVAFDGLKTAIAVRNFKKVLTKYKDTPKLFGTIHGKSFEEVLKCYSAVNELVDYIGFSYRIWCEDIPINYPVNSIARGLMRINLLRSLGNTGYCIKKNKPHHLLGISDPCEIYTQSFVPWIKSADSSTAYVHSTNNIWFNSFGFGNHYRVESKISFDDKFSLFNLNGLQNNMKVLDAFAMGEIYE